MEAPEYRRSPAQFAVEKQQQSKVAEHFMVDDLLDFSNDEDDGAVLPREVDEVADSSTVTTVMDCSSNSSSGSAGDTNCLADPSLSGELCVPYDELAELEWLSNFVEESFSSEDLQNLHIISGVKSTTSSENLTELSATTAAAAATTFESEKSPQVPAKARSKRSRQPACDWTSRLIVVSPTSTVAIPDAELISPPSLPPVPKTAKTAKKKESHNSGIVPAPDGRKCQHCQTDKTPQWRTGPNGPKTLCNACGVRYKSGRLVPEYRPAASPTFIMSKHSNSHRKVLELRRQKELMKLQQQQGSEFLHHNPQTSIYDAAAGGGGGEEEFLINHLLGPDYRQLI